MVLNAAEMSKRAIKESFLSSAEIRRSFTKLYLCCELFYKQVDLTQKEKVMKGIHSSE